MACFSLPRHPAGNAGREWDGRVLEHLVFDGKAFHLAVMRGGYKMASLIFYENLLSANICLKPIFEKLGWPMSGFSLSAYTYATSGMMRKAANEHVYKLKQGAPHLRRSLLYKVLCLFASIFIAFPVRKICQSIVRPALAVGQFGHSRAE